MAGTPSLSLILNHVLPGAQVSFVLKAAMEDEETVDTFKAAFEELDEGKNRKNIRIIVERNATRRLVESHPKGL
jgi:hypothetical protein